MNFSTKWDIFVIIFQSMVSKIETWREKIGAKGRGNDTNSSNGGENQNQKYLSKRETRQLKCWFHQEE